MRHEFVLPQVGMGMTEGHVLTWHREVGATVQRGEPLVLVETAKVEVDIEAPVSGTLREIVVQDDTTAGVGALLAWIETDE